MNSIKKTRRHRDDGTGGSRRKKTTQQWHLGKVSVDERKTWPRQEKSLSLSARQAKDARAKGCVPQRAATTHFLAPKVITAERGG